MIKNLRPLIRIYPTDKALDCVINDLFSEKEILRIEKRSQCTTTVIFKDNYSINFWTSNKMYAYCGQGAIYNNKHEMVYGWHGIMPSRKTNWKLLKIEELVSKYF